MNTYLVTGATGFVGLELVKELLANGKKVTALDLREDDLVNSSQIPKGSVEFIKADITDWENLKKSLEGEKFDCLIHLASLAGDTGNPHQMIKVNVEGFKNVLEYCRLAGIKRLVLVSTISVYGWYPATKFVPPEYLPVDENHPCKPEDMYCTTKRMQELLATTYYKQYGLETVVIRLTQVIGPRGKGGGSPWRDMAQTLAEGIKFQVPFFHENELCHYVDIRDVARMLFCASEHEKAAGQIFNCCAPLPVRGKEFSETVRKLFPGIETEYGYAWSMAQGDEVCFSLSKAEKLLSYRPLYSLENSLRSIKDWIDEGGLIENIPSSDFTCATGVGQDGGEK